jgi:DNA repair protein SbcC/Rad50
MRINKLRFKNINSLKGDHEIDFDSNPLAESGLILISGAMGSGKSTILDTITLGLFNEVPRLGKLSTNEISAKGSIITHFTKEAFAEVYYTTGGKSYVSKWSIAYNKNNNLKDYHMELWDISSEPTMLNFNKGQVPGANENIIGLNFDQFSRSILLSQGEFARFLKATVPERLNLLEKITGGDLYRKIGKAAYAKATQLKSNLDQKKLSSEALIVLSKEEKEKITQELIDNKNSAVAIDEELVKLNKTKASLENLEKLKKELVEKEREQDILIKRKQDFAKDEERILLHESLASFANDLLIYKNLKSTSLQLYQDSSNLKVEVEKYEDEIDTLLKKLSSAFKANISKENFEFFLKEFDIKYGSLKNDIDTIKERSAASIQDIAAHIKSLPDINKTWYHDKLKSTEALSILNGEILLIDQWMEVHHVSPSTPMVVILEEINTKKDELQIVLKNTEAITTWLQNNKVIQSLQNELKSFEAQNNELQEKLNVLVQEKISIEAKIVVLRQQKEDDIARASLEAHRENLVDGKPCPLCGATHHPYAHEVLIKIGQAEVDLLSQSKIHQELLKNVESINVEQNKMRAGIEGNTFKQTELQKRNNDLASRYNVDLNLTELEEKVKVLTANIEERNLTLQQLDKYKSLLPLRERYQVLYELALEFQKKHSLLESMLPQEMVNNIALSRDKLTKHIQSHQLLASDYVAKRKLYDDTNAKLESLERILSAGLMDVGFSSIDVALAIILPNEQYVLLLDKSKSLKSEIKSNEDGVKYIRSEMAKLVNGMDTSEDLTSVTTKYNNISKNKDELNQRTGSIQTMLAQDEETNQKLSILLNEQKVLESDYGYWQMLNSLIGDKEGKRYANFAQELTLEYIIELANRRLQKLHDRYVFIAKQNELYVQDTYMGNTERMVRTLSGGETFVLSLALALGLSDLASQNVKLDCLFIDEGFGSLDEETLDMVVGTLESLQAESNKTIAIISHVESLKERINTQLKLVKDGMGVSRIEVSGV